MERKLFTIFSTLNLVFVIEIDRLLIIPAAGGSVSLIF
jgi:hypothetical protein